jgi:phage-related protein
MNPNNPPQGARDDGGRSQRTVIARVIFTVDHGCMVLLHGFIKKTQATPRTDLDLARKRSRQGA